MKNKGTWTPWGISQTSEKIVRGIVLYTTAGHGGYHVSKGMSIVNP